MNIFGPDKTPEFLPERVTGRPVELSIAVTKMDLAVRAIEISLANGRVEVAYPVQYPAGPTAVGGANVEINRHSQPAEAMENVINFAEAKARLQPEASSTAPDVKTANSVTDLDRLRQQVANQADNRETEIEDIRRGAV